MWILMCEFRLLRPSSVEILNAILSAATSFPESFEPLSVALVANLWGNRQTHHVVRVAAHGVDTGKTVIPRARMHFLNLAIQLVLGLVLPQEQRASRRLVLTRSMGPDQRRRAITTVMVWMNIWIQRSRLEHIVTDPPEQEHTDPGAA